MDERRKYKNASDEESKRNYRQLRNAINRKCKLAKEEWIKEKCSEVEREMNIGKIDGAYRKVKENFGVHKLKSNNVLNKDGTPIYNTKGKVDRWVEYIEELYGGNELENGVIEEVEEDEMGETILRSEFKRALKDLNGRKAPE